MMYRLKLVAPPIFFTLSLMYSWKGRHKNKQWEPNDKEIGHVITIVNVAIIVNTVRHLLSYLFAVSQMSVCFKAIFT